MLEKSALIAGWKVNGKSEQRYVKEVAQRRLDATKYLGLLEDADTFIQEHPESYDSSESSSSEEHPVRYHVRVVRDDDDSDSSDAVHLFKSSM